MSQFIPTQLLSSFRENIRGILQSHANSNKLLTNEHPCTSGLIDDLLCIIEIGLFHTEGTSRSDTLLSHKNTSVTPTGGYRYPSNAGTVTTSQKFSDTPGTPTRRQRNQSFQSIEVLSYDKKRKRWIDILGYLNLEREWRSLLKSRQTSGGVLKECLNGSFLISLFKSLYFQLTNNTLGMDLIRKHYGSNVERCFFFRSQDLDIVCNFLDSLKYISFRLGIDEQEEVKREARIVKLIQHGNHYGWEKYNEWKSYSLLELDQLDGSGDLKINDRSDLSSLQRSSSKRNATVKLLNTKHGCLLNSKQRNALWNFLPEHLQQKHWDLKFSTREHQSSIQNFYSLVRDSGPSILIIQPSEGECIGVFASTSWRGDLLKKYYGDSDCMLFSFNDVTDENPVNIYSATQRNDFYLFSQKDSIAVGGGGHFALWIDEMFECGFSKKSKTFNNPPLLSVHDFTIQHCECWCFKSPQDEDIEYHETVTAWESVASQRNQIGITTPKSSDWSNDDTDRHESLEFSDASLDALTDRTIDSIGKEIIGSQDISQHNNHIERKQSKLLKFHEKAEMNEKMSKLQFTPSKSNLIGFSPSPIGKFQRNDSLSSLGFDARRSLRIPEAVHGCLLSVRSNRFKKLPKITDIDGTQKHNDTHCLERQYLKQKQDFAVTQNADVSRATDLAISQPNPSLEFLSDLRSNRSHDANLRAISMVSNYDYDIHFTYNNIRRQNIAQRLQRINHNSMKDVTSIEANNFDTNRMTGKTFSQSTCVELDKSIRKVRDSSTLLLSLCKYAAQIDRKRAIISKLIEREEFQSIKNMDSRRPLIAEQNGRKGPTIHRIDSQSSTEMNQSYSTPNSYNMEVHASESDILFTPSTTSTNS